MKALILLVSLLGAGCGGSQYVTDTTTYATVGVTFTCGRATNRVKCEWGTYAEISKGMGQ